MNYEEIESLLTEAEAANKKGNHPEAEQLCNLALEKIPHISNKEAGKSKVRPPSESGEDFKRIASLRAKAMNGLSESRWRRGMTNEAISPAEEALHLSIQAENKEQEAMALNSLGVLNKNISDYPHALEYYTKALTIHEEIGNKKGVASITGNIGNVYYNLSDYPRALEFFTKALAMYDEIGYKSGVVTNTLNIGNVYSSLSDYPHALEYYSKALAISEEIGYKESVPAITSNIGTIYFNLLDYPRALNYYSKALAINKEIGNKIEVARDSGNIGNVYFKLSDYSHALEYYNKARSISEEIGAKSLIAATTGNIGTLYGTKDFKGYDMDKAEDYLLESISMFEEIVEKKFEFHKSLAELYKDLERWDEALKYYEQYHEIEKEVVSEEAKKKADLYEQQKQAAEREKEIEIAKAESAARMNATTSLLHRVLPESISTRMINGEENISDFFPSVSILFADIQGFTAISANMKAIDVVRFLNYIFGEFDRIMKAHGCEKIKTIGDGYMAVAGAPIECEDHAERLSAAALEMQETIHLPEDILFTMPAESRFGIRIGLHTGSVVAGVIGEERFVYDIHSDAVNLASRMESSGEVGRVHVSSDFAEHLQARFKKTKNTKHGILFEDRGESNIKGKGMMKTYFINQPVII